MSEPMEHVEEFDQLFLILAATLASELEGLFKRPLDFTLVVHDRENRITHISTAPALIQVEALKRVLELLEHQITEQAKQFEAQAALAAGCQKVH